MFLLSQYLTPHKLISKIADIMANCRYKPLKNYLIKDFMRRYNVKLDDTLISDPTEFENFNDFFTRKLQPSAREICTNPNSIISPNDGYMSEFGRLNVNKMLQAKNVYYSVDALLGDKRLASRFLDGFFATMYLAPHNYHRVHMPVTGTLEKMLYIPGTLFSVNSKAVQGIPGLFAKNERVVTIFDTQFGKVAVILVGAMIVGGIETFWHGVVTPPHKRAGHIATWNYGNTQNQHIMLNKADEVGLFHLGSTVILLFEKHNNLAWNKDLSVGRVVTFGESIATVDG